MARRCFEKGNNQHKPSEQAAPYVESVKGAWTHKKRHPVKVFTEKEKQAWEREHSSGE